MRKDFLAQIIAALATGAAATLLFRLFAGVLSPHSAWVWALSCCAIAHLAWLLPKRRQALAAGLVLLANAAVLLLVSPAALISSLAIGIGYALLRQWFRGGESGRAQLIGLAGCVAGLAAACWLGSWTLLGTGIAVWTYLLVLACADLVHGAKTDRSQVNGDAFSRAAQALERSLRAR